jgi:hypothetical protein
MKKVLIALTIIFILLFISCERKIALTDNAVPELLSVFWENAAVSMNIGEIQELKWDSSRPIKPNVHSGGSAVVITGMTENGIQVRAIESGIDVVSLFVEGREIICMVTVNEELFYIDDNEDLELDDDVSGKIILPYTKKYLSIGQETQITVFLEDGEYGDDRRFTFLTEQGKHCITVEVISNAATIKAVGEGIQYLQVNHPKAAESRVIVYDVLPPAPPPPPVIDVSESPMIVRKSETKQLNITLTNGRRQDMDKFRFQIIENAYAINVTQNGNILNVTGIAPGAGKIRIHNPAALRDYDVIVIVD